MIYPAMLGWILGAAGYGWKRGAAVLAGASAAWLGLQLAGL
jgi:hypothetical protein